MNVRTQFRGHSWNLHHGREHLSQPGQTATATWKSVSNTGRGGSGGWNFSDSVGQDPAILQPIDFASAISPNGPDGGGLGGNGPGGNGGVVAKGHFRPLDPGPVRTNDRRDHAGDC